MCFICYTCTIRTHIHECSMRLFLSLHQIFTSTYLFRVYVCVYIHLYCICNMLKRDSNIRVYEVEAFMPFDCQLKFNEANKHERILTSYQLGYISEFFFT